MIATPRADGKVLIQVGGASITIEEQNDILYVQDIQGSGDPQDMMKLIRELVTLSQRHPLYFPIKDEYTRLRSILEGVGGTKQFELWRLG